MTKVQTAEYATRLTCEEARNTLVKESNEITSFESVPIRSSLNRILHEDLLCPVNVPNHTNSAMDGYAIQFSDTANTENTPYELKGSAFAGRPFSDSVAGNATIKIMTGAAMPDGTDTVIILEDAEEKNNQVTFKGIAKRGQNVRLAGEDLKAGQVFVNNYGAGGGVELPFGGVGHSGFGREKGFEALKGFSVIKTVAVNHG